MNEMEAHLNEIEAGRRQIANRMSVRSRGNHNHIRANIKLIIWHNEFNDGIHRTFLQDNLIVDMVAAHAKDDPSVTKKGGNDICAMVVVHIYYRQ